MSFHNNYGVWERKTKPENCPVCKSAPMPDGMIDLYELPHSWLNSEPVECMKWACHVTAKYHGIELYDLTDDEFVSSMRSELDRLTKNI